MESLTWEGGKKRKFSHRKDNETELIVKRHGGTQEGKLKKDGG